MTYSNFPVILLQFQSSIFMFFVRVFSKTLIMDCTILSQGIYGAVCLVAVIHRVFETNSSFRLK